MAILAAAVTGLAASPQAQEATKMRGSPPIHESVRCSAPAGNWMPGVFRWEKELARELSVGQFKASQRCLKFGKAALPALPRPNIRETNRRGFKLKNLNTCDSSN
jgi:hypothetical protein